MALGAGRVIAPYRQPGLRARAYMHVRWWICPFDRVLPLVPHQGRLLDVGCGSGLWLTYLALERPELTLNGVDPDERKLALAGTSTAGRLELRQGSIADVPAASFDTITILDVLCLVPDEVKADMLRACYRALTPGGTLVVKDADTRPWWKYAPTALEELLAVHVLRITLGRPRFQSLDALRAGIASAGFVEVEATRIDRGYLHPHVVVRARKPRPT